MMSWSCVDKQETGEAGREAWDLPDADDRGDEQTTDQHVNSECTVCSTVQEDK